jgi:putative ABC transport system permease protein
MTLLGLGLRNAAQNRIRLLLTALAVAVSVIAFVALRTVLDAWGLSAQFAAQDRLSTRHKVSLVSPLPRRYVEQIAQRVPGVRAVTHCDWFGARWPRKPSTFFANLACAANVFDLYPEVTIDPAALARFKSDKQAAILGDLLAKQLGLTVGDALNLESSFYPGEFRVHIVGIYSAPPRSAVDRASFFFRWDYKNDSMPPARRDQVGWIFTRIDDAKQSAAVSRAIDALFDADEPRTLTMSERAANHANLGAVSALLTALDVVSLIILLIMGLIVGNTLAMNARERASTYGVLRAIGFSARQLQALVLSEGISIAVLGYLLGMLLAYPIVELGMGRWLEENAGKFFPSFRLTFSTALTAFGLCILLSLIAGLLPARSQARLTVADALRHTG